MEYLINYINDMCNECVSDRMANVLTPKCRKRFLINLRIYAGATAEDLPEFCYNQVVSNLNRYLQKKTTLYTPIDTLVYNADFFSMFFPDIHKKLLKTLEEKNVKGAIHLISRSKVPATRSGEGVKGGLLRNILKRDKFIKEGSFIYDLTENYFVIWYNNSLYVADINKGYTVCNAHREKIGSIEVLKMILPLYAEGKNFTINLTETDTRNVWDLKMVIPNKILINIEEQARDKKFHELTEEIEKFGFKRMTFNFTENTDLEITVEVTPNFTFDDINQLFNTVSKLIKVETISVIGAPE